MLLSSGVGAAAVSGPPVEINVIVPLTGPAAQYGQNLQQAFGVVEKDLNNRGGIAGRPIKFVLLDDQTNPQVTVQLVNSVVASGAQIFIGGSLSAMCKASIPLVAEKGPVMMCLSPAVYPPKGGYVFSSSIHPYDLAVASFRFFHKKGWNNIALMMATDATGQEVDTKIDAVMALPENRDLRIVAHEHFGTNDVSVAAQVSKILAARPQALLIWTGTNISVVFQALSDAGSKIPVATSSGFMLYRQMEQWGRFLPPELYFATTKWVAYPDIRNATVKDALSKYFVAFRTSGIHPDQGHQIPWDPALIVVSALRALGPDAKAPALHEYLERLHGFAGTSGIYDFRSGDQRGLSPDETIISEWVPSKQTWAEAK
jgi:branched-chain amino acid transport system substrate-binding protein